MGQSLLTKTRTLAIPAGANSDTAAPRTSRTRSALRCAGMTRVLHTRSGISSPILSDSTELSTFEASLSIIEVTLSSHAEAVGSPPGHARSADPQDAGARPAARVGHREAHSAAHRRCRRGRAGIAVSGAAPSRASGLDHRRVEGLGSGAQRQVLSSDPRRPAAAGLGAEQLEAPVFGGGSADQAGLTERSP